MRLIPFWEIATMAKNKGTEKAENKGPTIATLITLLGMIEAMATHLFSIAKGRGTDPIYWKRWRSTAFACEKQRKNLLLARGSTDGKPINLMEGYTDPSMASGGWDRQAFDAIRQACMEAYSLATTLSTGGTASDRLKAIADSMKKQSDAILEHANAEFPLAATKGKKAKA